MNQQVAEHYWSMIPSSAQVVLDLGCATGDMARFAPRPVSMFGLDADKNSVAVAGRFASVQQWDLDCARPLPYESAQFDAVVAKDVLEHLQKPWVLLQEVRRVLKPGGTLLVSVICEFGRRTWSDYTHVRGFTETTARQLIADAGFEVRDSWRMGGIPLSSRLSFVHLNRFILRVPPCHWIWTSSYELHATRPIEDRVVEDAIES